MFGLSRKGQNDLLFLCQFLERTEVSAGKNRIDQKLPVLLPERKIKTLKLMDWLKDTPKHFQMK